MIIEITPPPPALAPAGETHSSLEAPEAQSAELVFARLMELMHELQERGLQLGSGAVFPQLSTA